MNRSIAKSIFKYEKWMALAALIFLIWSAIFIFRTSFIAVDCKRYFCLFDDAMISMRYAWNFSHGDGLVWNTGERVQGYTNLLMTLLMSFSTWMFDKSSAVLSIQIFGIGLILGIAYTSMMISDQISEEAGVSPAQQSTIRKLSFMLALAYYPLLYWSLMGMETGLLSLLLCIAVLSAFRYRKNKISSCLVLTTVSLGLAYLTRNDSLIFAILIWTFILWESVQEKNLHRSFWLSLSLIGIYFLFVVGQSIFQYIYYGEVLPNTYILKLTNWPLLDRISNGMGFILPFLIQICLLLIPAIIDTFFHFQKGKFLLLSITLAAIGYQVYVGGDPWNYWRMISPTIPILSILFLQALDSFVYSKSQMEGSTGKPLRNISTSTQVQWLAFIAVLVANAYFLPEVLFIERPFYVSANQHNTDIAIALGEVTSDEADLGVFWAGAIPYFAERTSVDFLGKSDRYIAQLSPDLSGKVAGYGMRSLPGHNKYNLDYSIKKLQPTYIQGAKWGSQDVSEWAQARYLQVQYRGVDLTLLRNSTEVDWHKLAAP